MKFHYGPEVAADQRAALNVIWQRARADDVERGRFWGCLEQRADRVILLRRVGVGRVSRNCRPAAQRTGSTLHAGDGPVTVRPVARLVKDLAEVVEGHAPAIGSGHAAAK